MIRIAQTMHVHQKDFMEYEKRHNALWPDMVQVLKEYGATNYSIFLNQVDGTLFAYLEVPDKGKYDAISNHPTVRKWWDFMAPLMDTNPDNSPVANDLREVFHLD